MGVLRRESQTAGRLSHSQAQGVHTSAVSRKHAGRFGEVVFTVTPSSWKHTSAQRSHKSLTNKERFCHSRMRKRPTQRYFEIKKVCLGQRQHSLFVWTSECDDELRQTQQRQCD